MLCCQRLEVKNNYDFTLGRLAYESLLLVQASVINLRNAICFNM
jgi:hypothetical protein